MATPTEPVTDALYQALSSPEPDPQVVHAAIEEIRYLSGHNVIAAIEAKIDSQSARIDVQITEFRAEMDTRLTRIEAEIKTQNRAHRRPEFPDRRSSAGDLARDLAAHHSAGRAYLRPALQGAHWLGGLPEARGFWRCERNWQGA